MHGSIYSTNIPYHNLQSEWHSGTKCSLAVTSFAVCISVQHKHLYKYKLYISIAPLIQQQVTVGACTQPSYIRAKSKLEYIDQKVSKSHVSTYNPWVTWIHKQVLLVCTLCINTVFHVSYSRVNMIHEKHDMTEYDIIWYKKFDMISTLTWQYGHSFEIVPCTLSNRQKRLEKLAVYKVYQE